MKVELKMPRLRPEMKKGVLCAWLKDEGDTFEPGEAIYEIETDKVVNQIEAEHKAAGRRGRRTGAGRCAGGNRGMNRGKETAMAEGAL